MVTRQTSPFGGNGTTSLFIPARFMSYVSVGSAGASTAGSRFGTMSMPDAADSQINTIVDQASDMVGWTAFNVDLVHSNPNAGSGDVVLTLTSSERGEGEDLSAGDATLFNSTVTVGAQDILVVTRLASAVSADTSKLRHIRLLRDGDGASDTLSGAFNVLGWRLGKA